MNTLCNFRAASFPLIVPWLGFRAQRQVAREIIRGRRALVTTVPPLTTSDQGVVLHTKDEHVQALEDEAEEQSAEK
ncbi:hypothetical protein RRG08_062740 [Elysia crispata]|uniref:Uncharacterized protein n=1 Tax=Elysia crispata TaxID=231223 RepID=A0AAE0ZXW1_9GAST|nr:hypothetical protein RRG08_000696 [Elysia crispata]KAK3777292.1 hypothetical protein RRG08_062740 [Elysia crispata]